MYPPSVALSQTYCMYARRVLHEAQGASSLRLLRTKFSQPFAVTRYSTSARLSFPSPVEEKSLDEKSHYPISSLVRWPCSKEFRYSFDPVFLRDCCSCVRCVDPSTTQKTFDTADIPPNIHPRYLHLNDDGSVHVTWSSDIPGFEDHVSVYDPSFGPRNRSLQSRLEATSNLQGRRTTWDRKTMSSIGYHIDYSSYMNSPSALLSSLHHLFRYGLLFIHCVPFDTDSVSAIGKRIGPLKETLYKSTWDVKSVPFAKNVAYTSSHLGFHMDLLYVDNPPGLQILHCLQASTQGGESLFSDALRAVEVIQQSRPDHVTSLKNFQVTYEYHNNHEWYQQTRPHIETVTSPHEAQDYALGADPEMLRLELSIRAINWSPPFQAPFLVNIGSGQSDGEIRKYLAAIRHLKKELEADDAVFEQKLEPGTAVIFDNRRIVHARKAFENQGGQRWLRGAYVDTDAFRSRLRVLEEGAT